MQKRRSHSLFLPSLLCCFACTQSPLSRTPQPAQNLAPLAPVPAVRRDCQRDAKTAEEPDYIPPLLPSEEPFDEKNACVVSQDGLKRVGDAVLKDEAVRPALPARRWDRKMEPARLALIARRFALKKAEREQLFRDGFVVPARLADSDYVLALHEIFQSELPLYVSADAILHAVYASNDKLLAELEATVLLPRLRTLLETLHCGLSAAAPRFPIDIARDVDLYLTVARSLLADGAVRSLYQQEDEAAKLFAKAQAAADFIEVPLFGRQRMIDFSQYRPRGHYASGMKSENPGHADLAAYFRAVTWLSRIEWNIVSRSCVSSQHGPGTFDTPREAAVALALAELVTSTKTQAELDALDRAFGLWSGKREDVPLPKLAAFGAQAGIVSYADPALAGKLRQVIGSRYARTARTHYAWEGCQALPVISTLLGPRILPDAAALRLLVHSETANRRMVQAADVAYTLGHDRALRYLGEDLKQYPQLAQNLKKARQRTEESTGPGAGEDLFSAWFVAIRKLAAAPPANSGVPSFMQSEAFADLEINSAVAAFGQLRHNAVLMAAQTYDEGGCAIPEVFIEPAVAVYDALIQYAERGGAVLGVLDPQDQSGAGRYFARMARVLRILTKIARDELANRALTEDESRFLGMVVEITGAGRTTGGSPTFTGWYFDLFRDRRDAFSGASFIADYYTSSETKEVAYLGVSGVRMGIFVVDTAGAPRAFIGPVARAFAHVGPLSKRLGDQEGAQLKDAERSEPWAKAYSVAAPAEPPLTFIAKAATKAHARRTQEVTLEVFSTRALGPVTIELLDHHRRPLFQVTHPVGTAKTRFYFPALPIKKGSEDIGYEGVHVRVGEFDAWELDARADAQAGAPRVGLSTGYGHAYGGMPKVPPLPPRDPFGL